MQGASPEGRESQGCLLPACLWELLPEPQPNKGSLLIRVLHRRALSWVLRVRAPGSGAVPVPCNRSSAWHYTDCQNTCQCYHFSFNLPGESREITALFCTSAAKSFQQACNQSDTPRHSIAPTARPPPVTRPAEVAGEEQEQ